MTTTYWEVRVRRDKDTSFIALTGTKIVFFSKWLTLILILDILKIFSFNHPDYNVPYKYYYFLFFLISPYLIPLSTLSYNIFLLHIIKKFIFLIKLFSTFDILEIFYPYPPQYTIPFH